MADHYPKEGELWLKNINEQFIRKRKYWIPLSQDDPRRIQV